ncbi:MAG: radical SAM protein [Candidatus Omnitrophica bacterium]|nr:radical SAM protein [Candidatus Omnitrophota bacterium]
MDIYRIDSHKLMFHVDRVHDWLHGAAVYPIYIEIGITDICNQHCIFCAFDYLKHKPVFLRKEVFSRFMSSAARKGVKSIMLSGAGEPLLHPHVAQMVRDAAKNGIDDAITSNGVRFIPDLSRELLPLLSWFKVSIDAGTAATYARIHGCPPEEFRVVLRNMEEAVRRRDKAKIACTLGAQFLLLPRNYREAGILVRIARDIGLDYCVLKPYSQHPMSLHRISSDDRSGAIDRAAEAATRYSNNGFKVVYRSRTAEYIKNDKPYRRCFGTEFTTLVTSCGDVYPCNYFIGNKDFMFGNLNTSSFEDIWEGRRRKQVMAYMRTKWSVARCRKGCRVDAVNRYLWELSHPPAHVNFI